MINIIAIVLSVFISTTCFGAYPPQFDGLTKCQLSSNTSSLTSTCADVPPPDIARPAVGSAQTSSFGVTYKRITLPGSVVPGTVYNMFPTYAKTPVWNSDGTKAIVQAYEGGGLYLFDGDTYVPIRAIGTGYTYQSPQTEPIWSHNDPNVLYYVNGMSLKAYNVATQSSTTVRTFTNAECGTTGGTLILNEEEGNPSDDRRYWAWSVINGNTWARLGLIVYDMQTDTVIATGSYGANGLCGTSACPSTPNWVGMSHSGNHVIINWGAERSDQGDGSTMNFPGYGTEVRNRSLTYQYTISEKNWHCDLAKLSDGTDVFVGQSRLGGTNGYRAIRAVSLDTGAVRTSCMLQDYQPGFHISGRATSEDTKNWILFSVYNQSGGSIGSGRFAAENVAINMDTCEVARVAHTQSYWSNTNYYSEPHTTVNWDFTKIMWGSNWRNPAGDVQTYIAELGESSGDTTAPVRSAGSPTGALAAGTTSTTMSLTTDEAATCKFSTSAGTAYASMTNTFTTTGGTNHSVTVSGLSDGGSYTRYVRCSDSVPNVNTSDYTISWTVSSQTNITCYQDADNDLYGHGVSETVASCSSGYYIASHFTALTGDCNDGDAAINPGATEVCGNSIDEDCSGADTTCGATMAISTGSTLQIGPGTLPITPGE